MCSGLKNVWIHIFPCSPLACVTLWQSRPKQWAGLRRAAPSQWQEVKPSIFTLQLVSEASVGRGTGSTALNADSKKNKALGHYLRNMDTHTHTHTHKHLNGWSECRHGDVHGISKSEQVERGRLSGTLHCVASPLVWVKNGSFNVIWPHLWILSNNT